MHSADRSDNYFEGSPNNHRNDLSLAPAAPFISYVFTATLSPKYRLCIYSLVYIPHFYSNDNAQPGRNARGGWAKKTAKATGPTRGGGTLGERGEGRGQNRGGRFIRGCGAKKRGRRPRGERGGGGFLNDRRRTKQRHDQRRYPFSSVSLLAGATACVAWWKVVCLCMPGKHPSSSS